MRIAGYTQDGRVLAGLVGADGSVRPLGDIDAFWRDPAVALAAPGPAVGMLADLAECPAVPSGAQVLCVGLNYRLHAIESHMPIPTIPVIFSRWARTLTAGGAPAPAIEEKFDWECELGVVIGRPLFRADEAEAEAGIFGYCAFNDLSARSFQLQTPQWTMGKNSPASGPMSAIVSADEVGDPAQGLRITTRVNGRTMQDSTTADMIFTVPQLIAHISQAIALAPGDLIVTGTPSGVGLASGEFLKPGDIVEVEVEKIGVVRTPIIAA